MAGIDLKRVRAILDHDDTIPDLRRYFGVGLPAQQVPPFTGGWFERIGRDGERDKVANRITADDLIAVETLRVQVPSRVALDLLHGELGGRLAAMLTDIPPTMPLAHPDATGHVAPHSAADQAWHLLEGQVGDTSRARAERRLPSWFTTVAEHEIPELLRPARTLDAWRDELLAYFDTGGISNGPTEAMNALIKKIKRIGHGYRNFANYRLRLLLQCGVNWQTPAVTPIRGRLPRLAA